MISPGELRKTLVEEAKLQNVRVHVVEKDFGLSYVLAAIAMSPGLSESLVFKGGTALKKCLFKGYRFSEDLDFTAMPGLLRGKKSDVLIERAARDTAALLQPLANTEVSVHRVYNPGMQKSTEQYSLEIRYPWPMDESCKIKLEICYDEPVILEPRTFPLIHGYDDGLAAEILCYQIPEVVAEKLRCVLQTLRKIDRNLLGANSRARDFYDLWHLLKNFPQEMDPEKISAVLKEKCRVRRVTYRNALDFLRPDLTRMVSDRWDAEVVQFVGKPVAVEVVIAELHELFPKVVLPNEEDLTKDPFMEQFAKQMGATPEDDRSRDR